ncbi:MAG: DNA translocase FtsK [bacterium]|nr:DNA translocase FtsK [bacterium]
MVVKTDSPVYVPEGRTVFIREILSIVLGLVSILLFLALLSWRRDANWIGPVGGWIATNLVFILGEYICFALPVMLALSAAHGLRGAAPLPESQRSWLRGLGGLALIVSSCALLALLDPAAGREATTRAFELGGLIGNLLINDQGAGLGVLLGRVGAFVVFGGLTLIGLVLITETLLRDLARLLWKLLRLGRCLRHVLKIPAWVGHWVGRWPSWRVPRLARAVEFLAALRQDAVEYVRGIEFRRPHGSRTIGIGPVIELVAAPSDGRSDDITLHAPGGEAVSRSSAVFPRPKAGPAPADLFRGAPPEAIVHEAPPAIKPRPAAPTADGVALENPVDRGPDLQRAAREKPAPVQAEMDLFPAEYQLPPHSLLSDPPTTLYRISEEEKTALSRRIEQTLAQFKVEVEVIEVIQGPVITRFALKVAPGVRVNKIQALESELAMALKAQHVRILAPIPGQAAVGIEVPNKRANPVMVKELLTSDSFLNSKSPLSFALGKNIAGEPVICDLAQMPHLLIAGTTGSGKSVCLNTIIASLLYRNKPDRVKFVMIDPKRVELSIYQAIPHLCAPVVSETRKAAAALAWCIEQMEERYRVLAEIGVRNIDGYNAVLNDKQPNKKAMGRQLTFLPHVVIIIDELADLMMVARNEVEEYVIRLAQMARAVGMHLIIATQRPSVNVITGIIKANFPSRIAFQVSSKVDSRTILDMNGAEALMGRGDMLYSPGGVKPFRIQGAFVADAEIERLADYIREQEKARYEKEDFEARPTPAERAKAQLQIDESDGDEGDGYPDDGLEPGERRILPGLAVAGLAGSAPLTPADMELLSDDMLYDMALRLILESRKASVSYIQRRMKIGYSRAGRIMDMLEEKGIVGPYQGSKPRDLLVDPEEYLNSAKDDS